MDRVSFSKGVKSWMGERGWLGANLKDSELKYPGWYSMSSHIRREDGGNLEQSGVTNEDN